MSLGVHSRAGGSGAGIKAAYAPWETFWLGMLFGSLMGFAGANGADPLLALYSKNENKGRGY
jgi:hypothetical protein